ncbi:MAG: hypothetical protein HFE85_05670 [Clostridiales bacterium]|nr:hypothetical protein [Clostridiales bacterium]
MLERHDQHIKSLQHQVDELHQVQGEIKSMNETLIELANELRHTNEHLARHEQKIDAIEAAPRARLNQIVTAIIAALAGGVITAMVSSLALGG